MGLNINTKIYINKDPEKVWKIFYDFKSYPEWNPFLTRIENLNDKELLVEFMGKSTFKPQVLKNEPNQEFRWFGRLGGVSWLFVGEHYFLLKPENKGTSFIHGENFNGMLAWIFWPFMKKKLESNFIKMNEALKARVEGREAMGLTIF